MKIEYDQEVDALYIRIQEKTVFRTLELKEGINLDMDEEGRIIGLEILDAKELYHKKDIFNVATENLIWEDPAPLSPAKESGNILQ